MTVTNSFRTRLTAAGCLLVALAQPVGAAQVLHIGNGADPETLDPQKAQTVPAMNIARDLFEGLTRLAPNGEPEPAAAERWEVSPDGRVYTFYLRPGLQWSNGDPLHAADFVAGLRRALEPATASPYGPVFRVIVNGEAVLNGEFPATALGITAPDPQQVRVQLHVPAPYLPGLMALPAAAPLHPANLQTDGAAQVSNGAYVLDEWVLQSHIRLQRNVNYRDNENTAIDTVYFHPTEDRDTELKRYRAGELDITYSVPQGRAAWIRRELPQDLRLAGYLGTYYLGFQCDSGAFAAQAGLRRALSLVIDREVLAEKVLHGLGMPAQHWIPPGVAGYQSPQSPDAGLGREARVVEARRLYAAAGYSAQRPLAFSLRYATSPDSRRLATVLAAMWKQALGVRVSLVNEENRALLSRMKRGGELQAFLWSWIGDYNDPSTFAAVLSSDSAVNYSRWHDAEYDARLLQATNAADLAARQQAYAQAEARLLAEVPIAPLYFYRSRHLVQPRVAGWVDHLLDYHYSRDLSLRQP